MKNSTREMLIESIKKNGINNYILLNDFFTTFSEQEVFDIETIYEKIDEYCDFFLNHLNFDNVDENFLCDTISMIEYSRITLKRKLNANELTEKEAFVSNILALTGNIENLSILDVGPDRFPASSLLLAKKAKRVTAMDEEFFLSHQALKNLNVISIEKLFSNLTDISRYDMVVGRSPCSAIKSIVSNCAKHNKPYIILLCHCALDDELQRDTPSLGWELVLPEIDPNIKFCGQYVYNFEATPNQLKKMIVDYKYVPFELRRNNGKIRRFIDYEPDYC